MDEMINEFTTNSTSNSKDKCEAVQQKEDEKLTQMEYVQHEASSGKRKLNFISDEASSNEQGGNTSRVFSGSNLNCSANEVNLDKRTFFNNSSKNFKPCFRFKRNLFLGHNRTSRGTGRINEEINSESNVSSLVHAASEEESEISGEEGTQHSFNEDAKSFLGSEEAIKNAGIDSKNIYFSRYFSDESTRNEKRDTVVLMDYMDRQFSSRVTSPACGRNEEMEANAGETLVTRENATADGAGPSGVPPQMLGEGNERRFVCNRCDEKFAEGWEFDAHYRTHTDEKAFVCNICPRKFTQKIDLERHFMTHTGEKPFVCDVCNKGFALKGNLKRHSITHTGKKPYECVLCKKGFAHQSSLEVHCKTHTGEKPFVCEFCEKDFADSSSLRRHTRQHTEKPYKCNICGKAYSDSRSCRKHHKDKHQ